MVLFEYEYPKDELDDDPIYIAMVDGQEAVK